MTLTSETQTKVPPTYLESNSVSIQAATKLSDDDSQTSDTETINSAIQVLCCLRFNGDEDHECVTEPRNILKKLNSAVIVPTVLFRQTLL